MDNPPVTLGPDEQRRLYVLSELLAGRLTTIEAALALDISIRHLKRVKARYRREGIAALAHGNRGRRPWHAIDPALAERVDSIRAPCARQPRNTGLPQASSSVASSEIVTSHLGDPGT